jgi:hypothetical protein
MKKSSRIGGEMGKEGERHAQGKILDLNKKKAYSAIFLISRCPPVLLRTQRFGNSLI